MVIQNYDRTKNTFSITDLNSEEAGALAGAISFAVEESTKLGMYKLLVEDGGMKAIESIADQLVGLDFYNSCEVK